MTQELQYTNYYRHTLLEGTATGFHATEELTYLLEDGAGSYVSPMLDTGGLDTTYNRLVIRGDFTGAKLEVIVAATNQPEAMLDNRLQSLEGYLSHPGVTHGEKAAVLCALPHVRMVNTKDILLHALSGRYVWVYLAVYPTEPCSPLLEGMRLELPRCTFTRYFPEIYQGNDLFRRYVAIFQSLYLDQERRVDMVPRLLDYQTTDDTYVEHLAGWLGIDNSAGLFSVPQLRHMIDHLDLFQGGKGTAYALPKILELITGLTPQVVEHFQWYDPGLSPDVLEIYQGLYGSTCDDFCVILNLMGRPQGLPLPEEHLYQLVEDYSVIGARFRIVYLRPECRADTHCYLDINSVLATPEIAYLDEAVFDAQSTVG